MSDLAHVLRDLPHNHDPRVLAGYDLADDAGIFRLQDHLALIQTVDFFTPVVDDPYTFGQIAAANALSDIYAMGGTPVTALNVTVYPTKSLPIDILSQILTGGADKAREAGVAVIGGHTVEGEEPMYGLAVTGIIDPDHIVKPSGGLPGDVIILTKPLGTGVIATALKAGRATGEHVEAAVDWMKRLSAQASLVMVESKASASTDVTGFGFLGHLSQMARASSTMAEIRAQAVPLMPGAYDYARRGFIPAGGRSNEEFFEPHVQFATDVDEDTRALFYDPQTSGGLLMAVDASRSESLVQRLRDGGEMGWIVGVLAEGDAGSVLVRR